ncbi:hypothetical protein [Cedecea sp.]|jgi:hypothetical protein|uniref:hypothetical protein n=1 Tax=Cedecea sp. TaxID=1970739 RepID=UPI002F400C4B
MLDHHSIEQALISSAHQQGVELNGKDLLDLRTGVAATLAAKERYRQCMNASIYY